MSRKTKKYSNLGHVGQNVACKPFENTLFYPGVRSKAFVAASLAGAEILQFIALAFFRTIPLAVKWISCWINPEAMKPLNTK